MDATALRHEVDPVARDELSLRELWATLPVTGPYPECEERWVRALELTLGALQPAPRVPRH